VALFRRKSASGSQAGERLLYYASDVHGSDVCWRKFLGASKFYKAGSAKLWDPVLPGIARRWQPRDGRIDLDDSIADVAESVVAHAPDKRLSDELCVRPR
jgi:hypothetical protein